MSDDGSAYRSGAISAVSFLSRLVWAVGFNRDQPDPAVDHRVGVALQGILSDEIIAGKESWAVPIIVGLGGGWNTYIRILSGTIDTAETPDVDTDDDPSDTGPESDVVGEDNEEGKQNNRSRSRRRRAQRRQAGKDQRHESVVESQQSD